MMVAGHSTNLTMITTNQANTIVLNRLAAVGVTDPHDGLVELRHAIFRDAPLFNSDEHWQRFAYLLSLEIAAGTIQTIV